MIKVTFKLMVFIIPLIISSFFNVKFSAIINNSNIMLGAIALGSSSLGFFIAGVSIMQTSYMSSYYKLLEDLGTNKKIISWLMTTIGYLFLLSFLSLVLLFFVETNLIFVDYLFKLWISTLIAAFLSSLYVVIIIIIVFSK